MWKPVVPLNSTPCRQQRTGRQYGSGPGPCGLTVIQHHVAFGTIINIIFSSSNGQRITHGENVSRWPVNVWLIVIKPLLSIKNLLKMTPIADSRLFLVRTHIGVLLFIAAWQFERCYSFRLPLPVNGCTKAALEGDVRVHSAPARSSFHSIVARRVT